MTDEIYSQIPVMTPSELWDLYTAHFHGGEIDYEEYLYIKEGKTLGLDFRAYLRWMNGTSNYVKRDEKTQTITVGNNTYKRADFDDEIEERTAKMRKKLLEIYEHRDTTESRT